MKKESLFNKAITKFPALTDDEVKQVTGGHEESNVLEKILCELSEWLDFHPNATKREVYNELKKRRDEYADSLTETEMQYLTQLLKALKNEEEP